MINLKSVIKTYGQGEHEVHALKSIDMSVEKGQILSLMGPSGSGKSTLLNLVGGLDKPSSGEIRLNGQEISVMSDNELTLFRRKNMGFVFQFFNLLPSLSALENVMFPLLVDGLGRKVIEAKAADLLNMVGLAHRRDHRPEELSGGEMQRVAIARAMVNDPCIILADEPTGNLDTVTGRDVLRLLETTVKRINCTMVLVTHDERTALVGDRLIRLIDGKISGDEMLPKGRGPRADRGA